MIQPEAVQPDEVYTYTVWRSGLPELNEDPEDTFTHSGEVHIPAGSEVEPEVRLRGIRKHVANTFPPPWVVEDIQLKEESDLGEMIETYQR